MNDVANRGVADTATPERMKAHLRELLRKARERRRREEDRRTDDYYRGVADREAEFRERDD